MMTQKQPGNNPSNKMSETTMDRQDLKARIALMLRSKELDESALENLSQQELLAAIGVYHQELIHQNEELKLGEEKLAAAENRYEELFKDAPLGYVVFDQDLKIHSANPAFCQLLEAQSKDLIGHLFEPPEAPQRFGEIIEMRLNRAGKAHIDRLDGGKKPLKSVGHGWLTLLITKEI